MRVYSVPNEYSSSITSRLLHVAYSNLAVLDQYCGDHSSAVFQARAHQLVSLCRSMVGEEKNQFMCPLMTS